MPTETLLRYAPQTLFRVSYRSPAELPPWKYVGGGRFDDPQQTYRVLYTSLSDVGACIEKFQDNRPSKEFADIEAEFELDGSVREVVLDAPPETPTGHLPFQDFALLYLGRLSIPQDTEVMDLTADANARYFSSVFQRDLTVSDLAADRDYTYTPHISRIGFTDHRGIAGIYSASKIDPVDTQNVTLYEGRGEQLRINIRAEHVESLSATSAPLVEACAAMGITIETPVQYHARMMRESGF
jgi:hypothetical protein